MADMYEFAVEMLESSKLRRYEVSNFSNAATSESVHNWNYWTGGDYIGIGPGAHSRFWPKAFDQKDRKFENEMKPLFREAHIQTLEPEPWMIEVERFGHGTRKIEFLKNSETILSELLATSLRTRIGLTEEIWIRTWSKLGRYNLSEFHAPPFTLRQLVESDEKCRSFLSDEILVLDKGLKLSPKGLNLLDYVLPYLINSLNSNWKMLECLRESKIL
jgi:coproporphyrinogen III oxidase-like Fe-S oxidoreductase